MIGSLFSGIGGLELGLERAGFGPTAWQVEIDPFCRTILERHWPDANRSICDVRLANVRDLAEVDVIAGGFPCQDVSGAGKGAGLAVGTRSGLWYEYRRIVSELRPAAIIVENVARGARAWLCQVRSDLSELGYDTAALAISASDLGASHERKRIFVVALAYADSGALRHAQQRLAARLPDGVCDARVAEPGDDDPKHVPPMGGGVHGFSPGLDGPHVSGPDDAPEAWEPPRQAPRQPWRRKSLTALGNSVMPAQAFVAGRFLRDWIDA